MLPSRYRQLLRLPQGSRRTLAVGVVAMALIVGLGRGVPAWRSWERQSVEAALEGREAVAASRALRLSEAAVADSTDARSTRLEELRTMLVSGDTPAAASASLVALIVEGARLAGLALGNTDVRMEPLNPDPPPGAEGAAGALDDAGRGAMRLAVSLEAEGDAAGLAILLAWIEEGNPALVVRELSVSQSGIASDPAAAEHLRISMTVEGLIGVAKQAGIPTATGSIPPKAREESA